ncbi:LCP family protein [Streptomyces xiaopingdaonensis]|uniref:LCP family protein n=1 Tax=Streptomyces xiaopingdaonensis TaxID=1565415 RepID=UPI0002DD2500|nr:LCP family protein [Streptomyces xiaopingdaonensis]
MTGDSSEGTAGREPRTWAARPTGRRRKPRTRRRKALVIGACTVAGAVALGGAGLGVAYVKFNGNISGVDINAALGTDRPEDAPGGSMDILVLGSDSRAGDNSSYGQDDGSSRSDTAMIVHVNEDHDRATVVSIPRDTVVDRPTCAADGDAKNEGAKKGDDGESERQGAPAQRAMFNTAYQVGGPACAVKTVESLSGVRMDHYVEVDFDGFKKLIDTLGGVKMTTTESIDDKESHLTLPAGTHRLDGEQALGLVRTRHGVGDGSDLGRIQLQQSFVKSLIDQVNSVGLFSNPKRLYDLADTATSALTTDSDLDSVNDLSGLAKTLKGVTSDDMQMTTLPVRYDPRDENRVVPISGKTAQVWKALKKDRPIPKSATKNSAGDAADVDGVIRDGTKPSNQANPAADER